MCFYYVYFIIKILLTLKFVLESIRGTYENKLIDVNVLALFPNPAFYFVSGWL